ncbi:MAG TPA: hypothetical protein VF300_01040 [Methanothrix sp.]
MNGGIFLLLATSLRGPGDGKTSFAAWTRFEQSTIGYYPANISPKGDDKILRSEELISILGLIGPERTLEITILYNKDKICP